MSLRETLVQFLEEPKHLEEIYSAFPDQPKTTLRGRLNENINKCFKRISKGVYLSTKGKSQAIMIEGDCWEKIKEFEDNSIDCIITDSPYTSLNKHYEVGNARQKNRDKYIGFETKDIDAELLREYFRVMKPGAHFFSFLPSDAQDTLESNNLFIQTAIREGFTFNKRFIWDKKVIGMGYNGRNKYEQIIFMSKGKRRMPQDQSIPDLLSHKKKNRYQFRVHDAEKPVELLMDLIKFSTTENEIVLDSFAGSFNIIEAALRLGRNCIAIEKEPRYIELAIQRFRSVKVI